MGQMANSASDIIRTGNRRFEIMYVYMQYLDEQTGVERGKITDNEHLHELPSSFLKFGV